MKTNYANANNLTDSLNCFNFQNKIDPFKVKAEIIN